MALLTVTLARTRASSVMIARRMHSVLLRNWKDVTLMVEPLN